MGGGEGYDEWGSQSKGREETRMGVWKAAEMLSQIEQPVKKEKQPKKQKTLLIKTKPQKHKHSP